MNKKVLKVVGIVAGIGVIFGAGSLTNHFVGAAGDWQTTAINNANAEIGNAGFDLKEEMYNKADDDILEKVTTELDGTIDDKASELERLLQQYYQMKLDGMTETAAFKNVEAQIDVIMNGALTRYKSDIDKMFADQQ